MKTFPRISVILPAYNADKYLTEAIDSILSQTFTDFELLIINDGSTDKTESIIKTYNDPRIKYHKHQQNLGLVATLNEGIELATGEFIARMDADDICLPKRFEKQIRLFEKKQDVMVCGTMNQWFGARNDKLPFPEDTAEARVGLLFGCFVSHPSIMFRKQFLLTSGLRYMLEFFPAEDYKLWTDCVQIVRFYTIQERLILYRIHPTQIGNTLHSEQIIISNRIKRQLFSLLSPQLFEKDKDYFIYNFLTDPLLSIDQLNEQKLWISKIIYLNKTSTTPFFDSKLLEEALKNYLKGKVLLFALNHYFQSYSPKKLFYFYFCSKGLSSQVKLKYHPKLIVKSLLWYKTT